MDRTAEWIKTVRGKNVTQEQFAKNIYHYKVVRNVLQCVNYHRNEVGNWERGEHRPNNMEAVLSIALFEFDKELQKNKEELTLKERNDRYRHANDRLLTFFGRYLYVRNLWQMLLMQVCRGIISFEEVLDVEEKLNQLLSEEELSEEELSEQELLEQELLEEELSEQEASEDKKYEKYALEEKTNTMETELLKIQTKEELEEHVRKYKIYFLTGNKTLGVRLNECFRNRQRYVKEVALEEAVRIYAPNYRDSMQRIFRNSGITKQWILDLCVHLRFNKEELEAMLNYAHVGRMPEMEEDLKFFYEEENMPIGSVKWYQYMEKNYPETFQGHFADFRSMSFLKKMMIMVVISTYIENMTVIEEIIPVDYLLESVLYYGYGSYIEEVVMELLKTISSGKKLEIKSLQKQVSKKLYEWIDYMQSLSVIKESDTYQEESDAYQEVYESYKQEFAEYISFHEKAGKNGKELEAIKLRYLAAIFYTILTGKYYEGRISKADLEEIKEQIEEIEVENERNIYFFINQYLVTFLTNRQLYKKDSGEYYIFNKEKQGSLMDMKKVCYHLWEILLSVNP